MALFNFPKVDLDALKSTAESVASGIADAASVAATKGSEAISELQANVANVTTEDVKSAAENASRTVQETAAHVHETLSNATVDDVKNAAFSISANIQSAASDAAESAASTVSLAQEQGIEGLVTEGKRRGVFNRKLKEAALADLQDASDSYEQWICNLASTCETLHKEKENSIVSLRDASAYVSSIANTPKEFDSTFEQVDYEITQFSSYVLEVEKLDRDWALKSGAAAQAGALAATGVAALGPAAAMGIATTFGTASTGVAISTLSGAAATNAAIAWLGGGAIAAGGGGMAAGSSLITFLGGPAGWILGGAGLITSTAIASKGNLDVATTAEGHTAEIVVEVSKVKVANSKAAFLREEVVSLEDTIDDLIEELKSSAPDDYASFTQKDKQLLMTLVNSARSLSVKLNEAIS